MTRFLKSNFIIYIVFFLLKPNKVYYPSNVAQRCRMSSKRKEPKAEEAMTAVIIGESFGPRFAPITETTGSWVSHLSICLILQKIRFEKYDYYPAVVMITANISCELRFYLVFATYLQCSDYSLHAVLDPSYRNQQDYYRRRRAEQGKVGVHRTVIYYLSYWLLIF